MKRKRSTRTYSSSPCMAHELDEPEPVELKAVQIKRIHDGPARTDGYRVLVDRLWPRGISKKAAALDEWPRDITPSTELRKALHDEEITWAKFRGRYHAELREHTAELLALARRAKTRRITLLTASSRDPATNHATVLKEALEALATKR